MMKFLISIVIKMKKCIHIQTQNIGGGNISLAKQIAWTSLTFDNVKFNIDAYNGIGYSSTPRQDCLIEIADKNEVFHITAEQLLHAIRFYIEYANDWYTIPHFKNTCRYIVPDAVKKP